MLEEKVLLLSRLLRLKDKNLRVKFRGNRYLLRVDGERERERDDLFDRERLEKRYNFIRKDILTINGLILGLAGKIKIAVASVAPSTPPPSPLNFLFLRCRDRVEDRRVTGSGGQIKIHVPLASTVLINSEDRRDRPC